MNKNQFYELKISKVRQLTDQSVALSFTVPDELKSVFTFIPGQYLTLRAAIEAEDTRRSYSICSSQNSDLLEVGIKQVPDGVFSNFASRLKAGDYLSVMPPQGRFTAQTGGSHSYLLIAAGSGITPCLSIISSVLESETESNITLVYGNRSTADIMFRDALNALKDRFTERLQVFHVLSREVQDIDLTNGRIDGKKITQFNDANLFSPNQMDAAYICGPEDMIKSVSESLLELGMDTNVVHFELFTTENSAKKHREIPIQELEESTSITITLDGTTRQFGLDAEHETVLAAAQRAGLDLPFSCEGGMCCTCRCKIVSGDSKMNVNYSLQDWEVEAGYTLACQTRPTSKNLVLDFDDT